MNERFLDEKAYQTLTEQLWTEVRDSVGLAVEEFNSHQKTVGEVRQKDCTARPGQRCIRLTKTPGNSGIEIFLDDTNKRLLTARQTAPNEDTLVCEYKLMPGRKGLQFFVNNETTNQPTVICIEQACQKAIEKFLFGPSA